MHNINSLLKRLRKITCLLYVFPIGFYVKLCLVVAAILESGRGQRTQGACNRSPGQKMTPWRLYLPDTATFHGILLKGIINVVFTQILEGSGSLQGFYF